MIYDYETLENDDDPDPTACALAMQRAINAGAAWRFQGSVGRAMMDAIEAGLCMLGPRPVTDYWGNRIPARTEVQEGTKGSRQYVASAWGEAHAQAMEAA